LFVYRTMRALLLLAFSLTAAVFVPAAEEPAIQSLIGREFIVHDDWAGQELSFVSKGGSILAVWRILGSGRPVLSEVEYPIETKGSRQCVFEVQLRDGSRGKVKIELGDASELRAYLNGIRFQIEEKKPAQPPVPMPPSGRRVAS